MKTVHFLAHIPKCGGLTVRQYYSEIFQNILVVQNNYFRSSDLPKAEDLLQHDAVVGHARLHHLYENQSFLNAAKEGSPRIIIHSIIRDPIDRIISEYNFKRQNKRHPEHAKFASLDGRDYVMNYPPNYQSRFLGADEVFSSINAINDVINLIDIERSVTYFFRYFSRFYPNVPLKRAEKFNVTDKQFKKNGVIPMSRHNLTDTDISELKSKHALDFVLLELSKIRISVKDFRVQM